MKKGIELLETVSKGLVILIFILFVISIFIPNGQILFFVALGIFFLFPVLESVLEFFHKWLYRNIQLGAGYMDEDLDMWEKFKWRIIKVIPFEKLPQVLQDSYNENIESHYKALGRDKELEEMNRRFLIDDNKDLRLLLPDLGNSEESEEKGEEQIDEDQIIEEINKEIKEEVDI